MTRRPRSSRGRRSSRWGRDNKITPRRRPHYHVEKTEKNRWLVSDMNEGLARLGARRTVVPISEAEDLFPAQIKANPETPSRS